MIRHFGRLLRQTLVGWTQNNAALHAAALAYYTIFSLAPLLIIIITIVGRNYEQREVEWKIIGGIEKRAGTAAASFVHDIIVSNTNTLTSRLVTGLGVIFLLYGASTIFLQLQASLHDMWGIQPRATNIQQSLVTRLRLRLIAVVIVLFIAYALWGSLLVEDAWTSAPMELVRQLSLFVVGRISALIGPWTTPLLYALIFVSVFKLLPHAQIRWRDTWPGALLTALLFWFGNYLISLYLSHGLFSSLYGAAGSVIVFLVWVYYSAWIILFGAKFTQIYADTYGHPIRPYPYMRLKANAKAATES